MAGPETEPIGSSSRSWASVTFTGAQHEFELFLMGKDAHDRANKLAECLPEAEFVVAGHIVVDAPVDRLSCSQGVAGEPLALMTVSLLTVEGWYGFTRAIRRLCRRMRVGPPSTRVLF